MAPLLRALRVVRSAPERRAFDLQRGRVLGLRAVLESLDAVAREYALAPDMLLLVRRDYEDRLLAAEGAIGGMYQATTELRDEVLTNFKRHLVALQRTAIAQAARHGVIPDEVGRELSISLDAALESQPGAAIG